jgi:hypothetical protein
MLEGDFEKNGHSLRSHTVTLVVDPYVQHAKASNLCNNLGGVLLTHTRFWL